MSSTCEVCNGTNAITAAGDLFQDREGHWHVGLRTIPCPECTEAGARLIDAEAAQDQAEYYANLAAAVREEETRHGCIRPSTA